MSCSSSCSGPGSETTTALCVAVGNDDGATAAVDFTTVCSDDDACFFFLLSGFLLLVRLIPIDTPVDCLRFLIFFTDDDDDVVESLVVGTLDELVEGVTTDDIVTDDGVASDVCCSSVALEDNLWFDVVALTHAFADAFALPTGRKPGRLRFTFLLRGISGTMVAGDDIVVTFMYEKLLV